MRPRARHAARVERDLGRNPRCGPRGQERHQPEPRLGHARPLHRARRERGRRYRLPRGRRLRERWRPRQPARLPGRVPTRDYRRRDRPLGRRRRVLEQVGLRRPRRARRRHHRRERARQGLAAASGTSFSSPIVAAAAAWVWTARPELAAGQVAEIVRRSAKDIGAPGRDPASGFGMLNVAAALAYPAPTRDPYEPNDDVDEVDPNGDRYLRSSRRSRPRPSHARTAGRLDALRGPARRLPRLAARRATVTATLRGGPTATSRSTPRAPRS